MLVDSRFAHGVVLVLSFKFPVEGFVSLSGEELGRSVLVLVLVVDYRSEGSRDKAVDLQGPGV